MITVVFNMGGRSTTEISKQFPVQNRQLPTQEFYGTGRRREITHDTPSRAALM
jgi:hypothetical protein